MSIWAFVMGFLVGVVVYACAKLFRLWRRYLSKPLSLPEMTAALQSEPESITALSKTEPAELAKVEPDQIEAEPVLVAEPLDMKVFASDLMHAMDPIAFLMDWLGEVRTAEARVANPDLAEGDENSQVAPDALSLYLARGLEEAGLLSQEANFPAMQFVRPFRAKTFYARIANRETTWGDMVRIMAIEGALNRTLFAWEHLVRDAAEELESVEESAQAEAQNPQVSLEDCYIFNQALARSITAQVGTEPISHASMSDILGEWGVRQALVSGFESFRLPFRLTTKFRLNLMGGDIAIEASYIPGNVQPGSVYSEDLGRIISTTSQMRERAAADYALRIALLLAAHAFKCSKRICHVFIALNLDTSVHHACVLTGDISREVLREYDLSGRFDAEQVCHELGLTFEIKDDSLQVVEQNFTLDSERFCPATRYEDVDLSQRLLPSFEAELLGATQVSDLAINEDAHRLEVAQQILRELNGSTVHDVNRILFMTGRDKDPSVQEAGKRIAQELIEGTVSDSDSWAFIQSFVRGSALDVACEKAIELINEGNYQEAAEVLTDALAPLDALDVYSDAEGVEYREFTSYVGRALYNRLLAAKGHEVRLVPDAYYSAQLLQSSAQMELGHFTQALGFAERAHDLNPLDLSPVLRKLRCYEALGDLESASEEACNQLELAFDLQSIGTLYYRLAFFEWHLGNTEVADACYQKALLCRTDNFLRIVLELQMMRMTTGEKGAEPEDVERILQEAGIPLAPTDRIINVLIEAAQAATDAEVFPVARSFATLLSSLSNDDVMHGIASSIELDPDR